MIEPIASATDSLLERAKETLVLREDGQADAIDFWRARACYFAEEILRNAGGEAAPSPVPPGRYYFVFHSPSEEAVRVARTMAFSQGLLGVDITASAVSHAPCVSQEGRPQRDMVFLDWVERSYPDRLQELYAAYHRETGFGTDSALHDSASVSRMAYPNKEAQMDKLGKALNVLEHLHSVVYLHFDPEGALGHKKKLPAKVKKALRDARDVLRANGNTDYLEWKE